MPLPSQFLGPVSISLIIRTRALKHWKAIAIGSLNITHWYNYHHKHSRIKFVKPTQRHNGKAERIIQQRKPLYRQAKEKNPARWSSNTRNLELPEKVNLNPERYDLETKVAL